MREYLFRGKRIDNGEWVTGNGVVIVDEDYAAIPQTKDVTSKDYAIKLCKVIPETIGVYIGWLDSVGVNVFTGDQIMIEWSDGETSLETISYSVEYGYFMYGNNPICELNDPIKTFTVTGNIHDVNPAAKEQL